MKALVIGAAHKGSIGAAIAAALSAKSFCVFTPSHNAVDVMDSSRFMLDHSDARILVLSHGRTSMGKFEKQSRDDIKNVIDTNVLGTIFACQEFVKATIDMPYRKSIFIIGSLGGSRVFTNSSVYCASKAAVAHLGRCMAWELTPKGFDVFVIEPGNVHGTPLSQYVMERMEDPDNFLTKTKRLSIITPEEIADAILQIILHNMTWLSGEPIRLAGGER